MALTYPAVRFSLMAQLHLLGSLPSFGTLKLDGSLTTAGTLAIDGSLVLLWYTPAVWFTFLIWYAPTRRFRLETRTTITRETMVGLVPITFTVIAGFAQHLQISRVKTQFPVLTNRLDVVNMHLALSLATGHASASVLLQR